MISCLLWQLVNEAAQRERTYNACECIRVCSRGGGCLQSDACSGCLIRQLGSGCLLWQLVCVRRGGRLMSIPLHSVVEERREANSTIVWGEGWCLVKGKIASSRLE